MDEAIRNSFHTHTNLCQHANGRAIDYVREAKKQGSIAIGISDHMPIPDGRWSDTRMSMDDLEKYDEQINEAREEFSDLIILKGLECEYFKEYHNFYEEEFRVKQKCEYLIGATHYYPHQNEWKSSFYDIDTPKDLVSFSKYFILTMESKIFDFIAHPDNFGRCYHTWDQNTIDCCKDMLQAAEELQVPIEINANGFRKKKVEMSYGTRPSYPMDSFWELASDYKVKAIINSDAHTPEHVVSDMSGCLEIARKYQIDLIPPFEVYLKEKNKV